MKMNFAVVALLAAGPFVSVAPAMAEDGDPAAGKTAFNQCRACHQVGPEAKNSVGPILNGVVGRPAGTYPGYNYSDANKNSGITWSEAQFKEYIKDPKAKVPGTKMAFAGIKSENEINNLWAYVSQFDADGKIIEFKVMIRPLKGINVVHEQMKAALEAGSGAH